MADIRRLEFTDQNNKHKERPVSNQSCIWWYLLVRSSPIKLRSNPSKPGSDGTLTTTNTANGQDCKMETTNISNHGKWPASLLQQRLSRKILEFFRNVWFPRLGFNWVLVLLLFIDCQSVWDICSLFTQSNGLTQSIVMPIEFFPLLTIIDKSSPYGWAAVTAVSFEYDRWEDQWSGLSPA